MNPSSFTYRNSRPQTGNNSSTPTIRRLFSSNFTHLPNQIPDILTEEEKALLGFDKWDGIRVQKICKFKTSTLSRPTSAAITKPKSPLAMTQSIFNSNTIPSVFNQNILVQPYATSFNYFREQSFSNKGLIQLLRDNKAENYIEVITKHTNPTIFLDKKHPVKPKTPKVSSNDPWLDRVKSIMCHPPSCDVKDHTHRSEPRKKTLKIEKIEKIKEKPACTNKAILTPSRKSQDKLTYPQCVWLYPKSVQSSPFSQPVRGKIVKDSPHYGVMFRPKSDNLEIEKKLAHRSYRVSTSTLKRLRHNSNRTRKSWVEKTGNQLNSNRMRQSNNDNTPSL